jgi:hypothetical protein
MNNEYKGDVDELFPNDLDGIDQLLRDELSRNPRVAQIGIPRLGWRIVGSKVNQAMHKALHFSVVEVFARAWQKAPELSEFADEKKYPPGKPWTVYLGKHEIATPICPTARVMVGGVELGDIEFDLELAAEFRSIELEISGGYIVAIGAGDFSVGAQIKYGSFKFSPIKTRDFKLSQPYRFATPGLKISGKSSAKSRESEMAGSQQGEVR